MAKKGISLAAASASSVDSFIDGAPDAAKGHRGDFVRIALEVSPEERQALKALAVKRGTTIRALLLPHIQKLIAEG